MLENVSVHLGAEEPHPLMQVGLRSFTWNLLDQQTNSLLFAKDVLTGCLVPAAKTCPEKHAVRKLLPLKTLSNPFPCRQRKQWIAAGYWGLHKT